MGRGISSEGWLRRCGFPPVNVASAMEAGLYQHHRRCRIALNGVAELPNEARGG